MLIPTPDLTQRIVLLTAALSPEEEQLHTLRHLLGLNPDWKSIVALAAAQGTAPLMYKVITRHIPESLVPADVQHSLAASYFNTHARTLAAQQSLAAVLAAFDAEKIESVLLKGMAMAEFVYRDTGLRPMGDTDLMVHPERLADAEKLLLDLGFVNKMPYKSHRLRMLNIHNHLNPFTGQHCVIELHNALSSAHHLYRLPDVVVWENKIPCTIAGQKTHVLAPADNLQFLSIHAVQHLMRANVRINSFVDIAEVVKGKPELSMSSGFAAVCKTNKTEIPVYRALDICRTFFNAPVSEELMQSLAPEQSDARHAFYCILANTPEKIKKESAASYTRKVLAIKGFKNKFLYLLAELFPSRAYLIYLFRPKNENRVIFLYFKHFFIQTVKTIRNLFLVLKHRSK